jgi:hypothetical protein
MNSGGLAFVSYARQDSEAAQRLAQDLKNAGVGVWIDAERIRPGERWRTTVSTAIEQCQYFIAVLSANSATHRGYVQAEWRQALDLLRQVPESQIYLIPVRLDDAEIVVHPALRELHWVDLFPDWAKGIRKVLASLGAVSAEPISAAVAVLSTGFLAPSLYLGWQLGRYEFIQGSEFPEAQAVEPELRAEIEGLLIQRGDLISLIGLSSHEAIQQTLARALGRDVLEHDAILIGIAAFRAQLVGSSADPAHNEELRQLAFSVLLNIDPRIVPNKPALFEIMLKERPASPAAVAELIRR